MDIALIVVTWAIIAVAGSVAVFVLTLVFRHASAVAKKRRLTMAERTYLPLVEGILNGAADPDEAVEKLSPGGEPWAVVEQMLRRASDLPDRLRAERAKRFLATAGFVNHYRHQLINGNRFARALAANRLADYHCREAVDDLITASADPDAEVRAAAVRALGRVSSNEALSTLVVLLEHTATGGTMLSRRIVSGSLTRFGSDAVQSLLPLLTHHAWRVRSAAVYVLGEIGDPASFSPIMERLADGEPDVRAKAARALGRLRIHSALFPLLSLLEDGAWLVRMYAIRALGQLNDAIAVAAIARRLTDAHWRVRQEAAQSLSIMGTPGLKALTQALIASNDRYAREQVVETLQRTPVLTDAIHRLGALPPNMVLGSPEAALLREVGRSGAVSIMLGAMARHADPQVRLALVRLMAELDHPRVDPSLNHTARADTDPLVRKQAAEQLKRRAPETEVA